MDKAAGRQAVSGGNIYWRNGIAWGRIQVAGREYRRSLRTRNRAEARRRFDSWKEALTARAHFGEQRLGWPEAVLRYVTEIAPEAVKPGTLQRYNVSFRQVDAFLAKLDVHDISKATLNDLISARRKQGATNATINRDLTAISAVLGACVEWGATERNVATDINRRRMTKERRDPIMPPSDADLAAVVRRAPGNFAAMISFLALTGCRQEEAASLEWRQIDLKREEIILTVTKTSRPRRIRIAPAAVELLNGLARPDGVKAVFWHGKGERYANVASRFRSIMKSAQESAQKEGRDFRPFRCHDLRHRYAILELQNGRDIYDLSRHLGHSSVKTTEIYLGYVAGYKSAQKPDHVQRFGASEEASDVV
jgi:integrase